MNTNTIPPAPTEKGYPCKGHQSFSRSLQPANNYHPAQIAYLLEKRLYTGRLIQDIAHLPHNLKFL